VARRHGLIVGGLLGELIHAKERGWIPDLKSEIRRLRTEARFFVSAEIEKLILKEAGE
jgi:predicted nucleic acid-binding protein